MVVSNNLRMCLSFTYYHKAKSHEMSQSAQLCRLGAKWAKSVLTANVHEHQLPFFGIHIVSYQPVPSGQFFKRTKLSATACCPNTGLASCSLWTSFLNAQTWRHSGRLSRSATMNCERKGHRLYFLHLHAMDRHARRLDWLRAISVVIDLHQWQLSKSENN